MKDDRQKAILHSLTHGASRIKACHAAGLPRSTFYDWLKKNEAFCQAVEEAETEAIETIEALCYRCAMRALEDPRYFRFMAFYLERKAGWIKPAPEKPHKSVQSVQTAPAANPHKTVQSPAPVGAQRAAPTGNPRHAVPSPAAPTENPYKTVQSPAPVGAQCAAPTGNPRHAVPSPAARNENPHKSVQSVQSSGRSSVAFMPAEKSAVIPNLKAKIKETMDANRARR